MEIAEACLFYHRVPSNYTPLVPPWEPPFTYAPPSLLSVRLLYIQLRWDMWRDRYDHCCDVSGDKAAACMSSLSYGIWQQNARLFIHFLTNRSTSCLFPMMLSSRQEITCHYFPHQSFSSLRSHVSLCVFDICPPRAFLTTELLIIMSRPSAVGRFSFFRFLSRLSRLQQSTSSQLHLMLSLLTWTQLKCDGSKPTAAVLRDPTAALVTCVWSDFIVTPVKLIFINTHLLSSVN